MKKYQNVLLSLGFFILAPMWPFLLTPILNLLKISINSFTPATSENLLVWPYIIFFITAMFFGLKNRAETPSILGNVILIIGTIILLVLLLLYYWASGWSA